MSEVLKEAVAKMKKDKREISDLKALREQVMRLVNPDQKILSAIAQRLKELSDGK